MNEAVRSTTLANGVRIVTEAVPGAASVALGLWVDTGSAQESPIENGVSHFLEHLVFKGTNQRSPRQIAEDIEGLGGSINAFTGKEQTCFHARVAAQHLPVAVDVLADLVVGALLRDDDISLEREVVLQEILEVEDTPDEFIHDFHLDHYWPNSGLGRPVAGTAATVAGLSSDLVREYRSRFYCADRLVVAAAGHLEHDELVQLVDAATLSLKPTAGQIAPIAAPRAQPGVMVSTRDIEQVHAVLGMPGLPATDPRHEVAEVLFTALGGGMSSRLFQSVREERGLAYSIYAFHSAFAAAGYSGVYAAVPQESASELVSILQSELESVRELGLTREEVERTKTQLVGSVPLALESTDNRMFRLARDAFYFGHSVPLDDTIGRIQAVSVEDTRRLAAELFAPASMSLALHGPVEAGDVAAPGIAA